MKVADALQKHQEQIIQPLLRACVDFRENVNLFCFFQFFLFFCVSGKIYKKKHKKIAGLNSLNYVIEKKPAQSTRWRNNLHHCKSSSKKAFNPSFTHVWILEKKYFSTKPNAWEHLTESWIRIRIFTPSYEFEFIHPYPPLSQKEKQLFCLTHLFFFCDIYYTIWFAAVSIFQRKGHSSQKVKNKIYGFCALSKSTPSTPPHTHTVLYTSHSRLFTSSQDEKKRVRAHKAYIQPS